MAAFTVNECTIGPNFKQEGEDVDDFATEDIRDLASVFEYAQLSDHFEEASTWCESRGARTLGEVAALSDSLERHLGLRIVEARRLRKALAARLAVDGFTPAPPSLDVGIPGLKGLVDILHTARLGGHLHEAQEWSTNMGAATLPELSLHAQDLGKHLGLREMEQRRLEKAFIAHTGGPATSDEHGNKLHEMDGGEMPLGIAASYPAQVPGLTELLVKIHLSEKCCDVEKWCAKMGATSMEDIVSFASHFLNDLGLKPFEKQRFMDAVHEQPRGELPWQVAEAQAIPEDEVVLGLFEFLKQARLLHLWAATQEWCTEHGAVVLEDFVEHADNFEDDFGLRPLEECRFRKALGKAAEIGVWARRAVNERMERLQTEQNRQEEEKLLKEAQRKEESERKERRERREKELGEAEGRSLSAREAAETAEKEALQAELRALRSALWDMKEDLYQTNEDLKTQAWKKEAAAAKIQAMFRGLQGRAEADEKRFEAQAKVLQDEALALTAKLQAKGKKKKKKGKKGAPKQVPAPPPPPGPREKPDPKDPKVIVVGGLNRTTKEDRIKEFFKKYGEVEDIDMKRFPGENSGLALVRFIDETSVNQVLGSDDTKDVNMGPDPPYTKENEMVVVKRHDGMAVRTELRGLLQVVRLAAVIRIQRAVRQKRNWRLEQKLLREKEESEWNPPATISDVRKELARVRQCIDELRMEMEVKQALGRERTLNKIENAREKGDLAEKARLEAAAVDAAESARIEQLKDMARKSLEHRLSLVGLVLGDEDGVSGSVSTGAAVAAGDDVSVATADKPVPMVPGLQELFEKALLSKYLGDAQAWCSQNGATHITFVYDQVEALIIYLKLKMMERSRLEKAVGALAPPAIHIVTTIDLAEIAPGDGDEDRVGDQSAGTPLGQASTPRVHVTFDDGAGVQGGGEATADGTTDATNAGGETAPGSAAGGDAVAVGTPGGVAIADVNAFGDSGGGATISPGGAAEVGSVANVEAGGLDEETANAGGNEARVGDQGDKVNCGDGMDGVGGNPGDGPPPNTANEDAGHSGDVGGDASDGSSAARSSPRDHSAAGDASPHAARRSGRRTHNNPHLNPPQPLPGPGSYNSNARRHSPSSTFGSSQTPRELPWVKDGLASKRRSVTGFTSGMGHPKDRPKAHTQTQPAPHR
eukprot:TRINITY_DN60961_c0_g1_i1.p1 TRINITY_DN60961_c0_g1~~TRINITY_DN60961_c0_g1_i1.p1  ORF type:complete len:1310 (-),score=299.72 TRINITY_DN60961_c0_g1_i1:142-3624(-)